MFFRVLRGSHAEGGEVYGKGRPGGDIVESKSDLSVLNGVGVSPKFLHLPDYVPRDKSDETEPEAEVQTGGEDDSDPIDRDLDTMTKAELIQFAADEEIDIDPTANKPVILQAIQDALTL